MIKSPIIVKDKSLKILNPREDYYNSTKKKILGRHGIFLKDFITNSRKNQNEKSYSEEKNEEKEIKKKREKEKENDFEKNKERDKGKYIFIFIL
jgi:hypothetical protein